MLTFRHANQRGHTQLPWLDSYHSFSFAEYYDPNQNGFSALRVINDDLVAPKEGFDKHAHRNMEILSLVLSGQIAHEDSEGNELILNQGEVQLMSAGTGIKHSEFNPSALKPLHFLQIWIEPNEQNIEPQYQQTTLSTQEGLTEIATPNGANNSLKIQQNARILQLKLAANNNLSYSPKIAKSSYIHLIDGMLEIDGQELQASDGVAIFDKKKIELSNMGAKEAFALIFDLP